MQREVMLLFNIPRPLFHFKLSRYWNASRSMEHQQSLCGYVCGVVFVVGGFVCVRWDGTGFQRIRGSLMSRQPKYLYEVCLM